MSKKYNNIFYKIFCYDNIDRAIENVYKNKDSLIKKEKMLYILENKEYYINEILKNKDICGIYKRATTRDSSSNKLRKLYIPKTYPDQIIHQAIIQQTEHCFRRGMYKWSCSSIKDRGPLYASNRLMKILNKKSNNIRWFIHIDICKYYDNIDLSLLKLQLRKLFKDKLLLKLFDKIIDTGATSEDKTRGLPIGNYTSQWLANFYLQGLDHYIKEQLKVPHYFRYADDFILLTSNKKELKNYFFKVKSYLERVLHLKIHPTTIQKLEYTYKGVTKGTGINFVGYMHFRNARKIRSRIWKRIRRMFLRTANKYSRFGVKTKLTEHFAHSLMSYYGYIKHSNSYLINNKYLLNVYYRIKTKYCIAITNLFNWCKNICSCYSKGESYA